MINDVRQRGKQIFNGNKTFSASNSLSFHGTAIKRKYRQRKYLSKSDNCQQKQKTEGHKLTDFQSMGQ